MTLSDKLTMVVSNKPHNQSILTSFSFVHSRKQPYSDKYTFQKVYKLITIGDGNVGNIFHRHSRTFSSLKECGNVFYSLLKDDTFLLKLSSQLIRCKTVIQDSIQRSSMEYKRPKLFFSLKNEALKVELIVTFKIKWTIK